MKKEKEMQEIEDLIDFLQKFFKSNTKEKNLIITKLLKKNQDFANWLNYIRDFTPEMRLELYDNLREFI